jgi:hypothetical protein
MEEVMSDRKPQGTTTSTTRSDAARVQSAVARTTGGKVAAGSYVGRMQSAADRNAANARKK